jgi:hypothetical protein
MEIIATLWSYDDRWMFQRKFKRPVWFFSSVVTGLISLSSAIIGISSEKLDMWAGFRVVVCVASSVLCFLLGINYDNKKFNSRKEYLMITLAVLGLLSLSSTWNLNTQTSPGLGVLSKVQVYVYSYAIIHILSVISLFFLIKILVLLIAVISPKHLVKIRH